jgi:hypothetical protein
MKTILVISLLTIGLILITRMITKAKTETQKFETIYRDGNFEIRFYPEAILASVTMNGSYDDSRNSGFRILAGYIFGGNEENQKIAMTSPVRMSSADEISTMSFVLPSKMEFEHLPTPVSERIVLHQSEPVYAAVIQYGGYSNNKEIEKKKAELIEALNKLNLEHKENFEYLGYNPPYQMINRKNEVLVELNNFNPEEFQKIMVYKSQNRNQ